MWSSQPWLIAGRRVSCTYHLNIFKPSKTTIFGCENLLLKSVSSWVAVLGEKHNPVKSPNSTRIFCWMLLFNMALSENSGKTRRNLTSHFTVDYPWKNPCVWSPNIFLGKLACFNLIITVNHGIGKGNSLANCLIYLKIGLFRPENCNILSISSYF